MVIIESAANTEGRQPLSHTGDFSNALDSDFFRAVVRGRDQNLNANVHSDRGTPAAEDQRPIHRDVVCEAPFRMFCLVHPVEDDGKAKPVSNGGPALGCQIENATVGHKRRQHIPAIESKQPVECLKTK
ncbi:MAG TPA: hypothetical protein VHU89_02835 [Acidobacteriaceae bacterium]|nr:hypothetical protein [Acidobacteriaceae bacterium]